MKKNALHIYVCNKRARSINTHLIQLLIYMKILKKAKGMLIYENKNNHELMIIPIEVNDHYIKWVDYTFEWLRQVRKAWEEKTLPKKNYRSNSKIISNIRTIDLRNVYMFSLGITTFQ